MILMWGFSYNLKVASVYRHTAFWSPSDVHTGTGPPGARGSALAGKVGASVPEQFARAAAQEQGTSTLNCPARPMNAKLLLFI